MTSTETERPGDVLDDLSWWTRPVAERDAVFARLRAEDPRPFVPELDLGGAPRGGGFWALTTFDDVWEVSRRPEDFCSGEGTTIFDQPPSLREYRGSIIDMDNPEHQRLRRIVSRGFTHKSLQRLHADVEQAARDIIGPSVMGLLGSVGVPGPNWVHAISGGVVVLVAAGSAAGSLALARRADDRELLEAAEGVAEVGLTPSEVRELLQAL